MTWCPGARSSLKDGMSLKSWAKEAEYVAFCCPRSERPWRTESNSAIDRALLNHLIRALQERRRDRQPEGLRGLEVDDQLELSRLFDGEIGGLRTLENAVDVRGRALHKMLAVVAVGHEPPGLDKISRWNDRRQSVLGGEVEDLPRPRREGADR